MAVWFGKRSVGGRRIISPPLQKEQKQGLGTDANLVIRGTDAKNWGHQLMW
jgi:hypothetical protein